jgi:hypothetical protein
MTERTTLLSPRPWTWRPYEGENVPFLALCDARENELGFVWIACEDGKALYELRQRLAGFVARSRADLERTLAAICAAINAAPFDGAPVIPRPWRIIGGTGWKEERVLSIVGPGGHEDEVLCRHRDHQTEIDFAAIVDAVNTRWP